MIVAKRMIVPPADRHETHGAHRCRHSLSPPGTQRRMCQTNVRHLPSTLSVCGESPLHSGSPGCQLPLRHSATLDQAAPKEAEERWLCSNSFLPWLALTVLPDPQMRISARPPTSSSKQRRGNHSENHGQYRKRCGNWQRDEGSPARGKRLQPFESLAALAEVI